MPYNREWYLFLDDERVPEDIFWCKIPDVNWIIVRTAEEAWNLISKKGMPRYISFDHDLGGGMDGYKLAYKIVEAFQEKKLIIPNNFGFLVHSKNPVGKKKIEDILNRYLKGSC